MSNTMDCNLKIGIIAGTPTDTEFGVAYLKENGIESYGEAIAETPQEQTRLQQLKPQELTQRVESAVDKLKERGVESVIVYCNSLSVSIDRELLREHSEIPVITPLDIYKEIATRYVIFGLIAANCNSCAGIERVILEENEDATVIGYGDLRIVDDIEDGLEPLDIIASHSIVDLLHLMARDGAQIIILGCTHFSYFRKELSLTMTAPVPILDPSFHMMQKAVMMANGY